MDASNVKSLRGLITLHFALIAVVSAMLVSYGSGSVFLPLFILVVCVLGFVLVDTLELFALNRISVAIGMTAGTAFAVGSYLVNTIPTARESGQLQAIAGLLVFPEAVLFLQRKNLRVFEQLAIFLLLEIMVAALVNDNLLFGILLLPIVLLWVSSLFHFARYATLVQIAPDIEVPMPKLAEVLFKKFVKSIIGDERPKKIIESQLLPRLEADSTFSYRRILQAVPLGCGAIAFSALFFYCLPRVTEGGFRPKHSQQQRVGLPKSMTLGQVGRAFLDPTPVMRVKLTNEDSTEYPISEGPYLRASVFNHFRRNKDVTQWELAGSVYSSTPIPPYSNLSVDATKNRDRVQIEFDLLPACDTDTFTLPPTFLPSSGRTSSAPINTYTQQLQSNQQSDPERHIQAYTLGSMAFLNGRQLDITPILPDRNSEPVSQFLSQHLSALLQVNLKEFPSVERLRARILKDADVNEGENLAIAKAIEQFFGRGEEYKYTLDLTADADPNLDPVEDFVANHRAGHCQFFAATMMIMLRQSSIPSRLVLGYKPREFNSYGNYYHVRQRDAHAWVEARFSSRELVGTDYEQWTTPNSEYWIRFDPSPSVSEDGVVDQPNQFVDFADKLWKGYVLEARELTGEKSMYAPAVKNSNAFYGKLADQWSMLWNDLASGKFGTEAGSIKFAWPLAVGISVIGGTIVLLWQLIANLPRIAPRFAKRLGIRSRRSDFNQEFFARCVRVLRKLGFERDESQTPQELTREAAEYLVEKKGVKSSNEWLQVLTQSYYRLRFGVGKSLSDQEQNDIQAALKSLEKSASNSSRRIQE